MNTTAVLEKQRATSPRRHRLAGADFSMAEEVMKAALLLVVPEDQKQRKAFEKLMPYLFVLRNKGCSWEQLTSLLNECGFKLQPSTVRNYYGEMQAAQMDVCQQRMNEQILLMNEVKKQTKGVDISEIAGRVSGIMEKTRVAAGSKIDAMFGSAPSARDHSRVMGESEQKDKPTAQNSHEPASPAPGQHREPASPAPAKNTKPASPASEKTNQPTSSANLKTGAGLRPAPTALQEDDHGFGLLTGAGSAPSVGRPAFFDLDDEPTIPSLAVVEHAHRPTPANESSVEQLTPGSVKLRCGPLSKSIAPNKPRDKVPAEVYQEGLLEHPAVAGVMLSLAERLYGAPLEFIDEHGQVHVETITQKRFRILWQKPVAPTPTTTSKNFTEMNLSLFNKKT